MKKYTFVMGDLSSTPEEGGDMIHLTFDVHAMSENAAVEKVQELGSCPDHAYIEGFEELSSDGHLFSLVMENVGIKGYFDRVTAENILFVEDSDKEPASI